MTVAGAKRSPAAWAFYTRDHKPQVGPQCCAEVSLCPQQALHVSPCPLSSLFTKDRITPPSVPPPESPACQHRQPPALSFPLTEVNCAPTGGQTHTRTVLCLLGSYPCPLSNHQFFSSFRISPLAVQTCCYASTQIFSSSPRPLLSLPPLLKSS